MNVCETLNEASSFIIGYDFSRGNDVGVLIVGKRLPNGETKIINAFQGDDAYDMYMRLTTVHKKEK